MERQGLKHDLIEKTLINRNELSAAIDHCKKQQLDLITYLLESNQIDSKKFANFIADKLGFECVDLDALLTESLPLDLFDRHILEKHQVIPLEDHIHYSMIAMANPTLTQSIEELQFLTGKPLQIKVACAKQIKKIIFQTSETNIPKVVVNSNHDEDASTIEFVQNLLLDSIAKGASDLHFEPYEKNFRVRQRIDGILYEAANLASQEANRICARIKVMSQLDIAERRIPQDGRFKLKLDNATEMNFRVSTCPTLVGEKIVIRILDSAATHIGIDGLGFDTTQKQLFLNAIHQAQGMVLVTGPTGSGKTVTLYSALNILNQTENNISTIEDPVEIYVPGINQVHVNLKAGLNFASALRAFLRQDPDIIMVGEMRDLETCEIAVKASQTGHLVLSTLHTNSAAETLTRLANMGLPPYNIATSVKLIIAQRLVRKLCNHCKIIDVFAYQDLREKILFDDKTKLYKNQHQGCNHCHQGFKGRVGIFELLPVTDEICQAILSHATSIDILKLAKDQGMMSLGEAGILKLQQGVISLDELNRVL